MNLTLNLEPNINPLLEKYSQPPIEFVSNNKIILKNYEQWNRNSSRNHTIQSYELCDIDTFIGSIDEDEFAKVTALEYTRKFQDKVDQFERYYGNHMRQVTEIDYKLETKRNYDWKNGIYDFLKAYTINSIGHNMKNSGVNRYFIRAIDGNRHVRNIQSQFLTLENLRLDCKRNVGRVVENIDEIIEEYQSNLNQIQNSTEVANQMSPNYKVYNFVNYTDMEPEPPYHGFLNLRLYTIVVAEENMMSITDSEGDIIGSIPTPQSYLVFTRPFSKVLLGKCRQADIAMNASTKKFNHTYISSSTHYDLATDVEEYNGISKHPWGSLCLSSHSDDIMGAIVNHDYSALLMKISNWNNLYNNSTTNPHNMPSKVLYQTGLNPEDDNLDSIKYLLGFKTKHCFSDNLHKHRIVQDNQLIRSADSEFGSSALEYGDYVVTECDIKQCPLRSECIGYNNQKLSKEIPNFYEMVESILGFILDHQSKKDEFRWSSRNVSYRLDKLWSSIITSDDKIDRYPTWFFNLMYSYDYHIYDEVHSTEDAEQDAMMRTLENWSQAINSQGESRHAR